MPNLVMGTLDVRTEAGLALVYIDERAGDAPAVKSVAGGVW